MRFRNFQWDEINIVHISKHNVSPEEAEKVCLNKPLVLKGRHGRYYALGQTDHGRYLTIIIQPKWMGITRVITARDMTQTERHRYFKK